VRGRPVLSVLALLVLAGGGVATLAAQAADTSQNCKIWVGRAAEFEAFIEAAEVIEVKDLGVGVTKPKKATLAPGGLVGKVAFKPIRPGRYGGFWESYKAEIAAYELDKLLGLDMVPPSVEKRIGGDLGVAVMWVSPTKSFKDLGGVPTPPAEEVPRWNRQLSRAKLFHNLIGNIDPNLGNWLVDPGWNLVLIDHSRAFTTTKDLVHEMNRVDAALWQRIEALDEQALVAALGPWLGRSEIRAALERRERMRRAIGQLEARVGEAAWFR